MWGQAVDKQQRRRRKNRRGRPREKLPRINVGDTVLVAEAVGKGKLDMTWTGPHQVVTALSRFVFETIPCLPNVGSRKPKQVHVVRLRRFANGSLGSAVDREAIERSARLDYPDNVSKRLLRYELD